MATDAILVAMAIRLRHPHFPQVSSDLAIELLVKDRRDFHLSFRCYAIAEFVFPNE
jgi:hypothetical protein